MNSEDIKKLVEQNPIQLVVIAAVLLLPLLVFNPAIFILFFVFVVSIAIVVWKMFFKKP